ncbi:hypothetical protein D3C87_1619940 [compost metagenome]
MSATSKSSMNQVCDNAVLFFGKALVRLPCLSRPSTCTPVPANESGSLILRISCRLWVLVNVHLPRP